MRRPRVRYSELTSLLDVLFIVVFAALVQAAGLVETLQSDGPFTVFAPTDEAFAALGEDTINALLADPEGLGDILLYHVVPGEVLAADVITLDAADTALGEPVTISVTDGKVMIPDGPGWGVEIDPQ